MSISSGYRAICIKSLKNLSVPNSSICHVGCVYYARPFLIGPEGHQEIYYRLERHGKLMSVSEEIFKECFRDLEREFDE
jgi:hypothetical protein